MVNLDKQEFIHFITRGAILGDGRGTYWLGLSDHGKKAVRPALPENPKFWTQNFHGDLQTVDCTDTVKLTAFELLNLLESVSESLEVIPNPGHIDISHFRKFFDASMTAIKSGQIYKIVPYAIKKSSRKVTVQSKIRFLKNLITLCEKTHSFVYGSWNADEGFMGATPEMLFEKSGTEVQTVALAGTRSVNRNPESLLTDPKELSEHQFVVDGIAKTLEPLGKVKTGNLRLKKLTRFYHLETPIHLSMNVENSKELFSKLVTQLHPTPALGGFPKAETAELLASFDADCPRKNFGAPFGIEFADGRALMVVMIRGARWDDNGFYISAGCGVVKESVFENELEELQLKIAAIEEFFIEKNFTDENIEARP